MFTVDDCEDCADWVGWDGCDCWGGGTRGCDDVCDGELVGCGSTKLQFRLIFLFFFVFVGKCNFIYEKLDHKISRLSEPQTDPKR